MERKVILLLFLLTFTIPVIPGNLIKNSNNPLSDIPKAKEEFSLNDLQYRTFKFFWEQADSVSGLIPDRTPSRPFSSIAATGFGLTSYIVGVEHNYITRKQAAARVLKTLRFLARLPQNADKTGTAGYKGFFYHFLDLRTGMRYKDVELSSIDTGLLMAGILSCMSYFDTFNDTEISIRELSNILYRRVEWDWMMTGSDKMSMGWHPGVGFINSTWDGYNEAMLLLIMAMGSPTHPIAKGSWEAWCKTYKWDKYRGQEMVNFGPLFGHQYSQMYIDFKGIRDAYIKTKGIDYFENSRRATLAQQAYCKANPGNWDGYDEKTWGLTACDGPGYLVTLRKGKKVEYQEYLARGIAAGYIVDDGTLSPTAPAGSIPFAPGICISALENMYRKFGDKIYGIYGFTDAFNVSYREGINNNLGWFDTEYIGIDQGPIVIQIENY
ncbi:MAG TPA: glucoamylase family protein, partial [Bacteroidales bacterium]